MKKVLLLLGLLTILSFAGSIKDSRDGKIYKTVKIGEQVWMAENLNYKTDGGICYDYKPENCRSYGRLYPWNVAKDVCPNGWHLPSKKDFEKLLNGKYDSFSETNAGEYNSAAKMFMKRGASYWSSTEDLGDYASYLSFANRNAVLKFGSKLDGYPVRCLSESNEDSDFLQTQTEPSEIGLIKHEKKEVPCVDESKSIISGIMTDSRDGRTYKTVKIGNQVWMAENLDYDMEGSLCYDGEYDNCRKYGRLYYWESIRNACPEGWHVPTLEDFGTLLFVSGKEREDVSFALRSSSWNEGDDSFGFSALPAGGYIQHLDGFRNLGKSTAFWGSIISNNGIDVGFTGVYLGLVNYGVEVYNLADLSAADTVEINEALLSVEWKEKKVKVSRSFALSIRCLQGTLAYSQTVKKTEKKFCSAKNPLCIDKKQFCKNKNYLGFFENCGDEK